MHRQAGFEERYPNANYYVTFTEVWHFLERTKIILSIKLKLYWLINDDFKTIQKTKQVV